MRTRLSILGAAVFSLLAPTAALALGIHVMIDGRDVIFTDVPQSAWFATYVQQAAEAGIVNGYKDSRGQLTGKYGPENNITFAEALKIAVESAGYDEGAYGSVVQSGTNHWSSAYVSVAKSEDFAILGTSYRLDSPATRAQVASMFASAFGLPIEETQVSGTYFTDVQLSTQYAAAIEALAKGEIVSGDTDTKGNLLHTFRPAQRINRAEVVKFAVNARAKWGMPGKGKHPMEGTQTGSTLVSYSPSGFSPSVLRVPAGTTVMFRNNTSAQLRVASDPHPTHTDYPGFDSGGNIAPGAAYSFTFGKKGTWGYHNHYDPSRSGTIVVE